MAQSFAKTFGWILFAMAAWQLAPAQALASCGDYVVGGQHAGFAAKTDLSTASHRDMSDMPKAPCNGLSCRKGPVKPVSIPSALVAEVENHRPLLPLPLHVGFKEHGTFGSFGERFVVVPVVAKEIERPPQLV